MNFLYLKTLYYANLSFMKKKVSYSHTDLFQIAPSQHLLSHLLKAHHHFHHKHKEEDENKEEQEDKSRSLLTRSHCRIISSSSISIAHDNHIIIWRRGHCVTWLGDDLNRRLLNDSNSRLDNLNSRLSGVSNLGASSHLDSSIREACLEALVNLLLRSETLLLGLSLVILVHIRSRRSIRSVRSELHVLLDSVGICKRVASLVSIIVNKLVVEGLGSVIVEIVDVGVHWEGRENGE